MANGNGSTQVVPTAGAMVRREIDALEMSVSADVGAAALAAQAEAEVKARWAIAARNPRDWDEVRTRLLKECKRPLFAASARYAKPVGTSKVFGPSIRFVEVALRCMGNVYCPVTVITDSPTERRVQVMVTDLESNISWPRQITINKTVERRGYKGKDGKTAPPTDRQVIGERTNSYGDKVYLVTATEDELANKEAAAVSKAIRQSGLRVIPGDLQDEAMSQCIETQQAADKADPDAARKKLIDAFTEIGISPPMLKDYIGHPVELLQPAEMQDLREIYAAIRDGESKWADVLDHKNSSNGGAPAVPTSVIAPPPPTPPAATNAAPAITQSEAVKLAGGITSSEVAKIPPAPVQEDPIDTLLFEIKACKTVGQIDKLMDRAQAIDGPRRSEVGKALSEQRLAVKGGGGK